MTIKDVEQLTGMTRANIRFYESEGLIIPTRSENGYRNYSETDVDELNKIKLLRTLQVSLEDIKLIKSGEFELEIFMENHMNQLAKEEELLKKSWDVCREIQKDKVNFTNLNANKYLEILESGILEQDVLEKDSMIWRRFFARTLDFSCYGVLWFSFISIISNRSISILLSEQGLLHSFVIFVIALIIEPILISKFGTTLGKWILGMYVADYNDRNPEYSLAAERTFKVLTYGYGFNLPIYSWIRYYKNFKLLGEKKDLPWETESIIYLKDKKSYRIGIYIAVLIALFGILTIPMKIGEIPKHQENVTINEFKENYVKLRKYHDVNKASFEQEQNINGIYVIVMEKTPEFYFIEENGLLKTVAFELTCEGTESEFISSCQNEMILSILAFGNKNKGEIADIITYISAHPYESFYFEKEDFIIKCDVEKKGYEHMTDMLFISTEGEDSYYHMLFEITKIEK